MANRGIDDRLSVFPIFLKVEDRFAVVVGDGPEAVAKARLLRESRIAIRLVSREPNDELAALVIQADLEHVPAHFSPELIEGAALVFAATGDEAADSAVVEAARARNIPVNAVDRPCLCDFYTPALVNRAPIAVAIGSEGAGPGSHADDPCPHRNDPAALDRCACPPRRALPRGRGPARTARPCPPPLLARLL